MLTVGAFQDVYKQARDYFLGIDTDHMPMDPVVRANGDRWWIESPFTFCESDVVTFQVSLEGFEMYWHESYEDESFVPSDDDANEFVDIFRPCSQDEEV